MGRIGLELSTLLAKDVFSQQQEKFEMRELDFWFSSEVLKII